jgi:hypothetical protein
VIRYGTTLPKRIAGNSEISPQNPIIHRAIPILQLAQEAGHCGHHHGRHHAPPRSHPRRARRTQSRPGCHKDFPLVGTETAAPLYRTKSVRGNDCLPAAVAQARALRPGDRNRMEPRTLERAVPLHHPTMHRAGPTTAVRSAHFVLNTSTGKSARSPFPTRRTTGRIPSPLARSQRVFSRPSQPRAFSFPAATRPNPPITGGQRTSANLMSSVPCPSRPTLYRTCGALRRPIGPNSGSLPTWSNGSSITLSAA